MRQILKPISIFSVFQAGASNEVNEQEHERTIDLLRRNEMSFTVLTGIYKGLEETSILVQHDVENESEERILIHAIAEKYSQESVLYADEARRGILVYTRTLETQDIGQLRMLSQDEPRPDSYSVTKDGRMYVFSK